MASSSSSSSSCSHDALDYDDFYYWYKHTGPDPGKDHVHSPKLDMMVNELCNVSYLSKSIHVCNGEGCLTEKEHFEQYDSLNNDFCPFILYSGNKQKRWEIQDKFVPLALQKLETYNNDLKVYFIDRYCFQKNRNSTFIWYHLMEKFPVHKIQSLNHDPDAPSPLVIQEYRQLPKRQRQVKHPDPEGAGPTTVAYNFIYPIPNYRKIMNKNHVRCQESCCGKRKRTRYPIPNYREIMNKKYERRPECCCGKKNSTRWRKIEFRRYIAPEVNVDRWLTEEDALNPEDYVKYYTDSDDDQADEKEPQKFYQLDEYFKNYLDLDSDLDSFVVL